MKTPETLHLFNILTFEEQYPMTDGEEKMIELMPLMLDELRGVKQEVRGVKQELKDLKQEQSLANMRLGAIEYILGHENPEFRNRIELLENRVGRLESR
ncbi:MAG: hypothetical protein MUF71_18795 [Candidatus Kapabacteria bacterium]|nr:hypothetical protein [Candidatus Kapabacteria bacterium]